MNKEHVQFGNNFFCLFMARKLEDTEPDRAIIEAYLDRAKEHGSRWIRFETSNKNLLSLINEALDRVTLYDELLEQYGQLLRAGRYEEAEEFNQSIQFQETEGIEAVGIWAWETLNPLLIEAAKAMKEVGIDPLEFYR